MGVLNPQSLLWAISIAILFAIYLRSRSRPTLEVSSLLLFDEAAAPTTRVRHLRIDPLFWLEMAVLGALTLALAGLYVRSSSATARGRTRALVFDLARTVDEMKLEIESRERKPPAAIGPAPREMSYAPSSARKSPPNQPESCPARQREGRMPRRDRTRARPAKTASDRWHCRSARF